MGNTAETFYKFGNTELKHDQRLCNRKGGRRTDRSCRMELETKPYQSILNLWSMTSYNCCVKPQTG